MKNKTITPMDIWKGHLEMMEFNFTDKQAELLYKASNKAKYTPDLRKRDDFIKVISHMPHEEYLEFIGWGGLRHFKGKKAVAKFAKGL